MNRSFDCFHIGPVAAICVKKLFFPGRIDQYCNAFEIYCCWHEFCLINNNGIFADIIFN